MTGMNTDPSTIPPELHEQARDWLLRLHAAPVSQADADAFRRWRALDPRHAVAFSQARQLWAALGPALQAAPVPPVAASATAQVATPLLPSTALHGHRRPRAAVNLRRRAFLGGAVAAAAGGWMVARSPLGMWPDLQALASDYRTATGERREVEIQGVAVAMAARTSLRRTGNAAGIILSQGEAQFVLPAQGVAGFAIEVEDARITPGAGAQVNVRCVGDDIRITCLLGNAQLQRGTRTVQLQPGWQARLRHDRIASLAPVALERIGAWQRGWLVFDDQPLAEVVEEINRYRTGRIVITGGALAQRRVQARIPLQQVDTFLDLVRDAYGVRVIHMPGGVILLG